MGYEWLALAAASLWAVAALISVKPARHLGAFAYSRWRMFLVSLMLASASHSYPIKTSETVAISRADASIERHVSLTGLHARRVEELSGCLVHPWLIVGKKNLKK